MCTDIRLPTNETQCIRFRDRDLTIYGKESDPYFQHFTFGDATNDFLLKVAEEFVCKDAVIFDIGANIGVTSAVLATTAHQGRVWSFEPSPTAFPLLEATIWPAAGFVDVRLS